MVTFAAKMVSAGYCAPEVIQNIEETFLKLRETSPLDANLLIRIRDRCLAASGTFVLVRS